MVAVYCCLLVLGMATGQYFELSSLRDPIGLLTSICLSYIMIEVGLEFSGEKRRLSSYGWDAFVATAAALLPTILCFAYFCLVLGSSWKPALISGLSSAPTSAGVLFSILGAAGLSLSWVFQKARTLAVLDDLVTILLLMPLGMIIHGFQWENLAVVAFICFFLYASFRWQNKIHCSISQRWLVMYAVALTVFLKLIDHTAHIHLEVLLPAFMWGCLLFRAKDHASKEVSANTFSLDSGIKLVFMFLVGLSLPRISLGEVPWQETVSHVVALTLLSNLGKCFTALCYRKESTWRERLALGITMFPRGEVGAAVLFIGLGFGFGGYELTLAMLTLALNLMLTGLFVWMVLGLLKKKNN